MIHLTERSEGNVGAGGTGQTNLSRVEGISSNTIFSIPKTSGPQSYHQQEKYSLG